MDNKEAGPKADAWSALATIASEEIRALGRRSEYQPLTLGEEDGGPIGENISDDDINALIDVYKLHYADYKKSVKDNNRELKGRAITNMQTVADEIKRLGGRLPFPVPGKKFRAAVKGKIPSAKKPGQPVPLRAKAGFRNRSPLPESVDQKFKKSLRSIEDAILKHARIKHADWLKQWKKANPKTTNKMEADHQAGVAWHGKLHELERKLFLARRGYAFSQAGKDPTGEDARLIKAAMDGAEKALKLRKQLKIVNKDLRENNELFDRFGKAITYVTEVKRQQDPILKAGQYAVMIKILELAKKARGLSAVKHSYLKKMLESMKALHKRQIERGLKKINSELQGKKFTAPPLEDYKGAAPPALIDLLNKRAWEEMDDQSVHRSNALKNFEKERRRRVNRILNTRPTDNSNGRQRVNSARPHY